MKRITLTIVFATAAAAGAQQPTRPTPAPAPRASVEVDREAIREVQREAQRAAMEASRIDREEIRENARLAMEEARATMGRMGSIAPIPPIDVHVPMMDVYAPMVSVHVPAVDVHVPAMDFGSMRIFGGDRLDRITPPSAWAQGDPADSIYKLARDLFVRGDWGRSARLFADIQKNYAKSAYANSATYWEAFARYKIGTTDELRQASRLLEPLAARVAPGTAVSQNGSEYRYIVQNNRMNDADVLGLYMRINGALAQRGDSEAAAKVAKYASTAGAQCDVEEQQVRTEALNALSQVDPVQALPILRRVIDKKDECSAQLRRSAVFILGRRNDAESANILLNVAKSDPNIGVRTEAINFLSRIPGDQGVNALEEMLKSEQDERIQRAAVHALMASDNTRARSNMRTLIDRKDAPVNLRIEAISSLSSSDRATNDDAAYLRGLYGRADNDRVKEAVINAVSRIGGPENDQWILGIVRNNNEPSSVRSTALSRLSRSPSVTTADLAKLYDASAESYDVRSRIISILGNRKDQEATEKLIEIAKSGTVVNHRVAAINALRDKKDPRATQLLQDILDGKRP